jgi:hypothetical protein
LKHDEPEVKEEDIPSSDKLKIIKEIVHEVQKPDDEKDDIKSIENLPKCIGKQLPDPIIRKYLIFAGHEDFVEQIVQSLKKDDALFFFQSL